MEEDLDHNLKYNMKNTLKRLGFIPVLSFQDALQEVMFNINKSFGTPHQTILSNNQFVGLKKMLDDNNK